jgi:hypothetical protein
MRSGTLEIPVKTCKSECNGQSWNLDSLSGSPSCDTELVTACVLDFLVV